MRGCFLLFFFFSVLVVSIPPFHFLHFSSASVSVLFNQVEDDAGWIPGVSSSAPINQVKSNQTKSNQTIHLRKVFYVKLAGSLGGIGWCTTINHSNEECTSPVAHYPLNNGSVKVIFPCRLDTPTHRTVVTHTVGHKGRVQLTLLRLCLLIATTPNGFRNRLNILRKSTNEIWRGRQAALNSCTVDVKRVHYFEHKWNEK